MFLGKVILFRELLLHLHEISCQLTFVGDDCYAWVLRDALVRLDLGQGLRRYWIIKPSDIKVWRITRVVGSVDSSVVVICAHWRR